MHAIQGRGNNTPVGLTIVTAEDNLLLRKGELLRRGGTDVLAAVSAHDALHEAVRVHDPDVVVIDIRMPPRSTDEGALRTISPRCGVVVLRQHASAKFRAVLLRAGSAGRTDPLKDRIGRPRCVPNPGGVKEATPGRGKGARARRGRANTANKGPLTVPNGEPKSDHDLRRCLLTSHNKNAPSGFDSPHLHNKVLLTRHNRSEQSETP